MWPWINHVWKEYVVGPKGEDPGPSTSGITQSTSSQKTSNSPAVVANPNNAVTQEGVGNLSLQLSGNVSHSTINMHSRPKPGHEITDSIPQVNLEELTLHLKRMYKNKVIPSVKWLKNGEDLIFKEYYVELEQTDSTNTANEMPMKIEEMFDEVDGRWPTRILVESPPGFGKTTLAIKMAFDWANGERYMQRFELVFLILLRNLTTKTLENELRRIVTQCRLKKRVDIDKVIAKNVLVILDGYDEINEISRPDITRLLYNVQSNEMTILVTSRSGIFPLERTELDDLLPPDFSNIKTEFCDKKITVKGISKENRREFLQKFCPDHCPNEILATFQKWPNEILEMLRSPMLLFLVSYFNAIKLPLTNTSTITDVYKSLINNIVKTYLTKQGISLGYDFHLFKISDGNSKKFQRLIARFGDLCLDHLANGNYKFEINEFTRKVYDLGFMIKYKVNELYKRTSYFDCFHLSIMEFCVAYYLWRSYKLQYFFRKIPKIHLLCLVIKKFKGTSMIYRFVCDLLETESTVLIKQLKKAGCNLFHGNSLWDMVSTLKESDGMVEVIADFVTSPVDPKITSNNLQFYKSEFFANIIRAAIRKNKQLIINVTHPAINLPIDIVIPNLCFDFDFPRARDEVELDTTDNSKLLCNSLILKYSLYSDENLTIENVIRVYLKSIMSLEKKQVIVVFEDFINHTSGVFYDLGDLYIWELEIFPTYLHSHWFISLICCLLETNRLFSLVLFT